MSSKKQRRKIKAFYVGKDAEKKSQNLLPTEPAEEDLPENDIDVEKLPDIGIQFFSFDGTYISILGPHLDGTSNKQFFVKVGGQEASCPQELDNVHFPKNARIFFKEDNPSLHMVVFKTKTQDLYDPDRIWADRLAREFMG